MQRESSTRKGSVPHVREDFFLSYFFYLWQLHHLLLEAFYQVPGEAVRKIRPISNIIRILR